jgi:hypothetical protein
VFSLKAVLDSKEALKSAVAADEWGAAAEHVEKADFLRATVMRTSSSRTKSFWEEGERLLLVVQPVMDTIHRIEADAPLLSQMLPMWDTLHEHFLQLVETAPSHIGADHLLHLFQGRRETHFHDYFYAAYLLDPINWVQNSSGKWMPPVAKLKPEAATAAKKCIKEMVAATQEQKASFETEWVKFCLRGVNETAAAFLLLLTERTYKDDGTVEVAPVEERRSWWATYLFEEFPALAKAASKLLAIHVTTCAAERNWSQWGLVYTKQRNRLAIATAEKIIFVRANLLSPSEQRAHWDIAAQMLPEDAEELEEVLELLDEEDEDEAAAAELFE